MWCSDLSSGQPQFTCTLLGLQTLSVSHPVCSFLSYSVASFAPITMACLGNDVVTVNYHCLLQLCYPSNQNSWLVKGHLLLTQARGLPLNVYCCMPFCPLLPLATIKYYSY